MPPAPPFSASPASRSSALRDSPFNKRLAQDDRGLAGLEGRRKPDRHPQLPPWGSPNQTQKNSWSFSSFGRSRGDSWRLLREAGPKTRECSLTLFGPKKSETRHFHNGSTISMTYVLPFRRQKRPIPSQRSPKRTYFFKSLWTFQDPAPDPHPLSHPPASGARRSHHRGGGKWRFSRESCYLSW